MLTLDMISAMQMSTLRTLRSIQMFRQGRITALHTKAAIMPSNNLTGLLFNGLSRARINMTSVAVNKTVDHRGSVGNRRTSAIADPSISAKSVHMMAISARA